MAWNGNNNRGGRPFIEVNFGRQNPQPRPIVEVDVMSQGGGRGYNRPMVEVDVFGSSRAPPPPPRPVVEVDIMTRPQYPAYPPPYSGQPTVVVNSSGQNRPPYAPYGYGGQQNGGAYNDGYGGYNNNNNGSGYGRNPYGNNYPPEHFNNPGW